MADILETLAQHARARVQEAKREKSPEEIERQARAMEGSVPSFADALAAEGMSFICECKKASPSKGLIAPDFPYVDIARDYERAGAAAISCLTETDFFLGRLSYLQEITREVSIPVLRKDFTIDPYMIYEARLAGASAVLLICAILDDRELSEYREIAESLGMDALVETHDEREVRRALASGAKIIGVNNRNLRDFTVDIHNSTRLRSRIPDSVLFVSESGIRTPEDVRALYENHTDAVLIGESLMRAKDKGAELDHLRSLCH